MSRERIEHRLKRVGTQLRALRSDLVVSDEQLRRFEEDSVEARLRALVSETPQAEREYRDARRHEERLRRHRDELADRISTLEAEQDDLLDRFSAS